MEAGVQYMIEETTEEYIAPDELIEEEPLEQPEGMEQPDATEPAASVPDRSINRVIPTLISSVVFAPSASGGDGKPLSPEELGKQYVAFTAPVLDMIEFHTCLGAVGELSQTTRLIIGLGVLVGGALVMKPKTQKKGTREQDNHTPEQS